MSCHREDWKAFDVLSSHMRIKEMSDDSEFILSRVKPGKWFAFCEYDEDFKRIRRVVMSHEDKADVLLGKEMMRKEFRRIGNEVYMDRKSWEFDEGILVISTNELDKTVDPSIEDAMSKMVDESIDVPVISSEGGALFACLMNEEGEHGLDILVVENKQEQFQVEGIEVVVR